VQKPANLEGRSMAKVFLRRSVLFSAIICIKMVISEVRNITYMQIGRTLSDLATI
jgi:hypothetical protein